jgi:hypothetical protein
LTSTPARHGRNRWTITKISAGGLDTPSNLSGAIGLTEGTEIFNPDPRQHTFVLPFSIADGDGTLGRISVDLDSGIKSYESFNAHKRQHIKTTGWTKPDHHGVKQRTSVDLHSGLKSHESYNEQTGRRLTTSDWTEPDANGCKSRKVHNHQSNKTYTEHTMPPELVAAFELFGFSGTESKAEVKTAFRQLSLKKHPDKRPPNERDDALADQRNLNHANELLQEFFERKNASQ